MNYISILKGDIKKYSELNDNKNTTHLNLWHTAKVVFTGKIRAANAYIRKDLKINNLKLYLNKLQIEKQSKSKVYKDKGKVILQRRNQQNRKQTNRKLKPKAGSLKRSIILTNH